MKRLIVVPAIFAVATLGVAVIPSALADTTILSGKYLVAAGDIACAPSNSAPTQIACREGETGALFTGSGLLNTSNMKGLLQLGDEQYSLRSTCGPGATQCGGVLTDFNDSTYACFTQQCGYNTAWGGAGSPLFPTPGEHDWQDSVDNTSCKLNNAGYGGSASTPNGCGLNDYFGNNTAAPGPCPCPTNYTGDGAGDYTFTFDVAAAHPLLLVVLNTGQCFQNGGLCGQTGAVTSWLSSTLSNTTTNPTKDCVVVETAMTRWSYYDHGDLNTAAKWLWKAAFPSSSGQTPDLWLSSHDHVYEDYSSGIDVNGGTPSTGGSPPYIHETVVGTGGHDMAELTSPTGSIVPDFTDNTNVVVVGGMSHYYSNAGLLQLVYDSTAGTLQSEFFEAYPNTSAVDPTGTWSCHT